MRIAVIEFVGKLGMAMYAYMACKSLVQQNCNVTLYTREPYEFDKVNKRFLVKKGFGWSCGPDNLSEKFFKGIHVLLPKLNIIEYRRLNQIFQELKKYDPNVIFVIAPFAYINLPVFKKIRRQLSAQIIFAPHEIYWPKQFSFFIDKMLLRQVYSSFDHYILHTEDSKEMLIREFHVPPEMITVVPIGYYNYEEQLGFGATHEEVKAFRESMGITCQEKIVLFMGTIHQRKGLDILLKAFAKVSNYFPELRLLIAGSPRTKDDLVSCEQDIIKYGIKDKVLKYLDYIPMENISLFFKASQVVVLPYKEIYQSGVLCLALGYGKPIIASNLPGLKQGVIDGENGFIFEKGNPDALAEVMTKMFSNDEQMDEMGKCSWNIARDKFSWDNISREILRPFYKHKY